ncbi:AI-2E family transporter [Marinobacteraceae bacterium S3BR75-40.1]
MEDPRNIRLDAPLRTSIHGLFVLGVLYTFYLAHAVVLPIVLGMLISLLFAPAVRHLERRGVHRGVSALALILLVLIGLGGLGWVVSEPVMKWMDKMPQGLSQFMGSNGDVMDTVKKVQESATEMKEALAKILQSQNEPGVVMLQSNTWKEQFITQSINNVAAIGMSLALSFFLLLHGDRMIINLARQLPRSDQRKTLKLVRESQHEIGRYLAVITANNLTVGVLTGLLCWAVGLPSPAVWGALAGVFRFVPYLGVIVTVGLLAVVSAMTLDTPWMMATAPVGYMLLTTFVGFFIEPHLHGYRMAINPIVIFMAVFFMGWLWGSVGVFLAVPLVTVVQVVLKRIDRLRPVYRIIAK